MRSERRTHELSSATLHSVFVVVVLVVVVVVVVVVVAVLCVVDDGPFGLV